MLIEMNSSCGGSGFPILLYEWTFTICLTPYNRAVVYRLATNKNIAFAIRTTIFYFFLV